MVRSTKTRALSFLEKSVLTVLLLVLIVIVGVSWQGGESESRSLAVTEKYMADFERYEMQSISMKADPAVAGRVSICATGSLGVINYCTSPTSPFDVGAKLGAAGFADIEVKRKGEQLVVLIPKHLTQSVNVSEQEIQQALDVLMSAVIAAYSSSSDYAQYRASKSNLAR